MIENSFSDGMPMGKVDPLCMLKKRKKNLTIVVSTEAKNWIKLKNLKFKEQGWKEGVVYYTGVICLKYKCNHITFCFRSFMCSLWIWVSFRFLNTQGLCKLPITYFSRLIFCHSLLKTVLSCHTKIHAYWYLKNSFSDTSPISLLTFHELALSSAVTSSEAIHGNCWPALLPTFL